MPTPRPLTSAPAAVLAAALAVVSVVIAAPIAAQDDALPISEREALEIVEDHIARNDRNNATLDLEGQAAIESPPIKTIDDANFREHQGRGETSLGESVTIDDVAVYVPDQSRHPLMFLTVKTFSTPETPEPVEQLLLFVQQGPGDPWKVSLAAQMLEPLPDLQVDEFGLAELVGPKGSTRLEAKPSTLAKKLAKLWTRSLEQQLPASATFEPGLLTTGIVQVLVFGLQELQLGEINVDFEFGAAENQPICFAARGGAFCLFVATIRESIDPVAGRFTQPPSRDVLGGLVPPGDYGGARFDRLAILGAFVPNESRNELVRVIGVYEGLVNAEGTPGRAALPAA